MSSGKSKNWFGTPAGKTFMKYANSWGATVVIIGAMFKILHLPGGTFVIGFGLSVEAALFFIAVFEPDPEHLDWTIVYPELKSGEGSIEEGEAYEEEAYESSASSPSNGGYEGSDFSGIPSSSIGGDRSVGSSMQAKGEGAIEDVLMSERISHMMESASIDDNMIQNLSESMHNLSRVASGMNDVMSIPLDQKKYSEQLNIASNNLESLNSFYEIQIEQSQLQADVSKDLVESLSNTFENSSKLHEQVRSLTDNISMLNTVYGGMLSAMRKPS